MSKGPAAAVAASAVAAVAVESALPLTVVLEDLSRMADLLTRLCEAEAQGRIEALAEELLEGVVHCLVGSISALMPWDYRKIHARCGSRAG